MGKGREVKLLELILGEVTAIRRHLDDAVERQEAAAEYMVRYSEPINPHPWQESQSSSSATRPPSSPCTDPDHEPSAE